MREYTSRLDSFNAVQGSTSTQIPFVSLSLEPSKNKPPKIKTKPFASIPVSCSASELYKCHTPSDLDRSEKTISSKKDTPSGTIQLSDYRDEINAYAPDTDIEILSQFKSLGFSRFEFQVYLGLVSAYIQSKKNGQPLEMTTKDFHETILKRENRLRSSDLEEYCKLFSRISTRRIRITTKTAISKTFSKKGLKNIVLEDNIISIAVLNTEEREGRFVPLKITHQVIRVRPTEYTLFEINKVKQISNYFPTEFLSLKETENDNILLFGFYLTRMHSINRKNAAGGSFGWEVHFKTLVIEALSNGEGTVSEYMNADEKTKYAKRNIIQPLIRALSIMAKHKYLRFKRKDIEEVNTKKLFDSGQKIEVFFNYNKGKLIPLE